MGFEARGNCVVVATHWLGTAPAGGSAGDESTTSRVRSISLDEQDQDVGSGDAELASFD